MLGVVSFSLHNEGSEYMETLKGIKVNARTHDGVTMLTTITLIRSITYNCSFVEAHSCISFYLIVDLTGSLGCVKYCVARMLK